MNRSFILSTFYGTDSSWDSWVPRDLFEPPGVEFFTEEPTVDPVDHCSDDGNSSLTPASPVSSSIDTLTPSPVLGESSPFHASHISRAVTLECSVMRSVSEYRELLSSSFLRDVSLVDVRPHVSPRFSIPLPSVRPIPCSSSACNPHPVPLHSSVPCDLRELPEDIAGALHLENSEYYVPLARNKRFMQEDIEHSDVALSLSLVDPRFLDSESLHHPHFDATPFLGVPLPVTFTPPSPDEESDPYLSGLESLSGSSGHLIAVEFMSQSMSLVNNVGMASRLVTLYHKASPSDTPPLFDESLRVVSDGEGSPFIGDIPRSTPVQALVCNMFSAPLAHHDTPSDTFLLVARRSPHAGVASFSIRRIDGTFSAGLQESRQRVMCPNSKKAHDVERRIVEASILNIIRGTPQYPGRRFIDISTLSSQMFPGFPLPQLRAILKKLCDPIGSGCRPGVYEVKRGLDVDEKFTDLCLSPEEVCAYQSMSCGVRHLHSLGIFHLTSVSGVRRMIPRLHGSLSQAIGNLILSELSRTPWSITDAFVSFACGRDLLFESDSGSSLTVSAASDHKRSNPKQPRRERIQGTSSDLRKLTNDQLASHLKELGVPESDIVRLGRWERVRLLSKLSSAASSSCQESSVRSKYAREEGTLHQRLSDEAKRRYQDLFEDSLASISFEGCRSKDLECDLSFLHEPLSDDSDNESELNSDNCSEDHIGDSDFLVPGSVLLCHTDIDWDSLGFAGIPRRPVAKVISTSIDDSYTPHASVRWVRGSRNLASLRSCRCCDDGFIRESDNESFRDFLSSSVSHRMTKHFKRASAKLKRMPPSSMVSSYVKYGTSIELCRDDGGFLSFVLTPSAIDAIERAQSEYSAFLSEVAIHSEKNGKHRKPNLKAKNHSNSLSTLNSELKSIIESVVECGRGVYKPFEKSVSKRKASNNHDCIVGRMSLDRMLQKCRMLKYSSVDSFLDDAELIESNGREIFGSLASDLLSAIRSQVFSRRELLASLENSIDPLLS